jgi:hypothetical protein
MDKACPHILNVGPHRIIDFTHIPGYYLPHAILDKNDFYMCTLTATECESLDYNRCQIYINHRERLLERIVRKKLI